MSATFVFLQVGNSIEPTILVKSIRKLMPDARIIQCSDKATNRIDGISDLFRVEGDINNLMTFRLKAFSELSLDSVAVYLDTDMVFLRPLDPNHLIGTADAVVCERSFYRESIFNPNFDRDGKFDWSALKNRTLYDIYPFIACFTITKNCDFWVKAHELLLAMPPMYHYWFGDQEAIKAIVQSNTLQIKKIPESTYACLPEMVTPSGIKPRALHFKGPNRKKLMLHFTK